MKKRIIIISAVCVVLIIAAVAVWLVFFKNAGIVENKDTPEYTIKNFEKAFNDYDIDAMLDCIHPTYRKTIDLLSKILPKQKWNLSFVLNLAKMGIPLLPNIPDLNITSDDLPNLSLTVIDSKTDENNAECTVSGTLKSGAFSKDFEYVVTLEKIDGIWYIVKTN